MGKPGKRLDNTLPQDMNFAHHGKRKAIDFDSDVEYDSEGEEERPGDSSSEEEASDEDAPSFQGFSKSRGRQGEEGAT